MREAITMTGKDQGRAHTIVKVVAGDLRVTEAALLLGLSERSVWRLKQRFLGGGVDGIVHGNRGRRSPRRLDDELRDRVVDLARDRFAGANDCHLAELLAEEAGIVISRQSLQRILRAAGLASPRRRRPPRHRSRRDRMPQAGLLLQLDGSRHDWLEARGPRLTLVGGVDDATGIVTAATFRDQEDAAGYLFVLRETVRRHGVPVAVYRDRHGIFETTDRPLTLEEQLADTRRPTQFGRALAELGVGSIAARSPQAKGRIERVWGTFQDRLVTELRLAGVADRDAAEVVLARFLGRFNRRFSVPPADARPAWRPGPRGTALERVCCLKYRRVVANDHTVRAGATILQLPARSGGRGYAGRRVELHLRLDGRLVVWDGTHEILSTPAPGDPVALRALGHAPVDVGHTPPSVGSLAKPPATHPWRQVGRGSKLYRTKQSEAAGLSGSPGS
jgi:transposase